MPLVGYIRILLQVIEALCDPMVWVVVVLHIPLAVVITLFPERHGDEWSTRLDGGRTVGALGPALAPGHSDVGYQCYSFTSGSTAA